MTTKRAMLQAVRDRASNVQSLLEKGPADALPSAAHDRAYLLKLVDALLAERKYGDECDDPVVGEFEALKAETQNLLEQPE